MYYLLQGSKEPCRWIDDCPRMHPDLFWTTGKPIIHEVPDPIEMPLVPSEGAERQTKPSLQEAFYFTIPTFSDALIAAMKEFGVNNFELYNVTLIDPDNDKKHTNYKAVNILGLAVAKPDGLVFDIEGAKELNIFRLAKSTSGIIVHEKLKAHLETAGFNQLFFIKTSNAAL